MKTALTKRLQRNVLRENLGMQRKCWGHLVSKKAFQTTQTAQTRQLGSTNEIIVWIGSTRRKSKTKWLTYSARKSGARKNWRNSLLGSTGRVISSTWRSFCLWALNKIRNGMEEVYGKSMPLWIYKRKITRSGWIHSYVLW